ncbi:hypothetical protein PCANB_002827 [Pneumocystis canis]|nr:hypothetical protein PCANB_002827 [Pneumocystis canis]
MSLEKSLDDIIYDKKRAQNSRISKWLSRKRFLKNRRHVFCYFFSLIFRPFLTFNSRISIRLLDEYFSIYFYQRNYDEPWKHDLYEELLEKSSNTHIMKQSYQPVSKPVSYRVRIENLHYELTEDDLNRIGPVSKLNIKYDRSGRSTGIAYVNFEKIEDAHSAINQFNGANAAGQPITLTLDLQPPYKPQKKADSLFNRISSFKVNSLYQRRSSNTYRPYRRKNSEYKTQEDLDNELDKYMNVVIQSKNTEKPMVID